MSTTLELDQKMLIEHNDHLHKFSLRQILQQSFAIAYGMNVINSQSNDEMHLMTAVAFYF